MQDLDWDPQGRFLLSVSTDQTARIFAPWRREAAAAAGQPPTWHELARPQVHGYDMQCVCFAAPDGSRYVSGADEKLLRVFEAPLYFLKSYRRVCLGEVLAAGEGDDGG